MTDDKQTEQPANENERRSEDELWKEFLSVSFYNMLRSVLPDLANVADTTKPVRFLETELRRLARFTRRYSANPPDSRKFVDILAEVPLISGENAWILLHVEIQGRGGKENFPLRMHRYRCLLEGRFNRPVAGLAILVQPIPADQTEGVYRWEGYGSEVTYRYPVFRIYEGDEDALRKSDNPFDLAHYAGMQAWKQRSDDVRKLDYMKILLAELNKRGWSHEEKMALLWFIEGVMHIEDNNVWDGGGQVHAAYPLRFVARTRAIDSAKPPACFRRTNGKSVRLVACLWEEELESRKEAGDMYVSLMERKGMEKGMALNKIQIARKMLAAGEPGSKILMYAEITPEQLDQIRREEHPTAN